MTRSWTRTTFQIQLFPLICSEVQHPKVLIVMEALLIWGCEFTTYQ
uniref:Uncharacterized protein n=1 Tax=Rhizophora mucronata TaxID=61149 RepID=A0A2P2KNN2_RHIMU